MFESNLTLSNEPPIPSVPEDVQDKQIEMHLLKNTQQKECQFWLGLFKPGTTTTEELIDAENIKDIFKKVATDGLQSDKPTLITQTNGTSMKSIYLIPYNDSAEVLPRAYWMSNLAKALQGLQATEVGCYIPTELESQPGQHELLEELILNLVFSTKITKFYLLSGEFGANTILNVALSLKQDLQSQKNINMSVFH